MRLTGPEMINHDNVALGHPKNTDLGSSGPLEASRGPEPDEPKSVFSGCPQNGIFVIGHFQSYHFLFGLVSRGPRPPEAQNDPT